MAAVNAEVRKLDATKMAAKVEVISAGTKVMAGILGRCAV